MSNTNFQFESKQPYQLDAIHAVVDLFDGQMPSEKLVHWLQGEVAQPAGELNVTTAQEVGAIGNNLLLDKQTLLANLQAVQDRNGLPVASEAFADEQFDFDIEMETGTGKTYVYLRTAFELAQKYGFSKFIILVPSVAIREGVNTSIRLMRDHFAKLYPAQTFDSTVYSGDRAEDVQAFATATNIQFLIMTIGSIRENVRSKKDEQDDEEARLIINRKRDSLNGLRPIDYLMATRPIVIIDEPQNMESSASTDALARLKPAFTLRYSATHKLQRNLVYRLDPVDAHDLGLVKQIVVAEVSQQGADAAPYIKLLDVQDIHSAKLELACRKADGTLVRTAKKVKRHQDLAVVTGNAAYEGWRMNEIRLAAFGAEAMIELVPLGAFLSVGESIGGANDVIYKEMIRETVREHLRKEAFLHSKGIKVLSLFFVDKVASFLGDGTNNDDANGDIVCWFDEVFLEERNKSTVYKNLLPQAPSELRKGYFAQLKKAGKVEFKESSETRGTKADDDAYEIIMQDKQRLLTPEEPVRFIFSHSALREGWDNPNVFQICSLREMNKENERRQTLGRGLRLPVAKTEQGFVRIADRSIATLTVVANESYSVFASNLQNDYLKAGVAIGLVRRSEFAKLVKLDANGNATEEQLGFKASQAIYLHLEKAGFIKDGKATAMFQPQLAGFTLGLPDNYASYEEDIIQLLAKINIGQYVKPKAKRQQRKFNKALYATKEFELFWNTISQKTTYRVQVQREQLIANIVAAIEKEPHIEPLRIEVTHAGVQVLRGGTKEQVIGARRAEFSTDYDLPDIISELQCATSLTRKSLVDILCACGKLEQFIQNPNDFIVMVKRCIQGELAKLLAEGVQYEKIGGSIYELRELQEDGLAEKEHFIDQMYKVQNAQKTDFDYVLLDSEPERLFAERLDSLEDVKLFMKLPARFKVPTPLGDYNPDWAIIKHVNGEDRIYMIRETKGTMDENKRRPSENAKIKAAQAHFNAIGVMDYGVSAPTENYWNL